MELGMSDPSESLIRSRFPELSGEQVARAAAFREALELENSRQNLTRLVGPEGFVEGHLRDVVELERSGALQAGGRYVDLGSGGGVPGLLSSLLYGRRWILVEAERQKAEFLSQRVEGWAMHDTEVIHGRIESILARLGPVSGIAVRAVGKVEKLYSWLDRCSTWNTLILFKGPNWGLEWAEFQGGRFGRFLEATQDHQYETLDSEPRLRRILTLRRVPRGTN
ncbi:MAG: class I SAM-dependent methyltransferase [Bdellovibrionales bacterium]|nr:class I SAM-dependent methyltransferase [Bdellovibrionales bacterium]